MNVSQYFFSRDIESQQNSGRNHTSLSMTTNWKCPDVRKLLDFTINITDL